MERANQPAYKEDKKENINGGKLVRKCKYYNGGFCDIKEEAVVVFKSKSSVQENCDEMTLQQIRKHVLAGAGET